MCMDCVELQHSCAAVQGSLTGTCWRSLFVQTASLCFAPNQKSICPTRQAASGATASAGHAPAHTCSSCKRTLGGHLLRLTKTSAGCLCYCTRNCCKFVAWVQYVCRALGPTLVCVVDGALCWRRQALQGRSVLCSPQVAGKARLP